MLSHSGRAGVSHDGGQLASGLDTTFSEVQTTSKTMGVHVTTIVYLRIAMIQIRSTFVLMGLNPRHSPVAGFQEVNMVTFGWTRRTVQLKNMGQSATHNFGICDLQTFLCLMGSLRNQVVELTS